MNIGSRLRAMREERKLSPSDVETRANLPHNYIERLESEDFVPSIETLEEIADVLGVPPYQLFYDDQTPLELPHLRSRKTADDIAQHGTEEKSDLFQRLRGRITSFHNESGLFLLLRKLARDKKHGGANES